MGQKEQGCSVTGPKWNKAEIEQIPSSVEQEWYEASLLEILYYYYIESLLLLQTDTIAKVMYREFTP